MCSGGARLCTCKRCSLQHVRVKLVFVYAGQSMQPVSRSGRICCGRAAKFTRLSQNTEEVCGSVYPDMTLADTIMHNPGIIRKHPTCHILGQVGKPGQLR